MTTTEPSPAPVLPVDGHRSRGRDALAGVLAAAAALASGELVAGLVRDFASPLEAVAEKFIDVTPGPVERWAIETFGGNDKLVLVVGALATVLLLGALVGLVARRRPILGVAGVALLGGVGVAANLTGVGGAVGAVPSVVAVPVGVLALLFLLRSATPGPNAPADLGGRRDFLRVAGIAGAVVAVSTVAGRWLGGRFSAVASRAAITLPPPVNQLPPIPDGVSLGVDGITPFITPFDQFYRVDTALTVPQVPAEGWSLRVHGMVDREVELSYDDLLGRELIDADITLTCVSNPVGGDLIGNARWRGVRLADLLDEAGVDPAATQVVGRSVDGYTCGFPVEAVYDRDALVVVGMNGEPLPIDRGFPARLLVPGLYGYVSATKWLSDIEITTFEAFDQYWVPRGWDEQAPIKTQTRIDVPQAFDRVDPGPVDVAGVAWAQTRGIERVEVRVDDGPWQDAELADALNDTTWRQWRFRWDATSGRHRITVRSTDGSGQVQTDERAEPFPDGASGWQSLFVEVR